MAIDKKLVREMMVDFLRLKNKLNKIDKQPLDFGTGDLLYPTEIDIIDEIGKKRGETVTELSRLFGVTKGAVSQTVGKLSRKGYVKKVRNKDMGKEILLSLTPKGYKAFEAHIKMHNAFDDDFVQKLENVNSEQLKQFIDILKKIEAHADKYINLTK